LQIALAMQILCFCPPEMFLPCFDISESMPLSMESTNSAWATDSALRTSSSVASGLP